MQLARFVLVVAASSGALASAGPDLVHEIQGRFHDALLMPRQNTKNLQTFTGALGGIKADAVSAFSSHWSLATDFAYACGRMETSEQSPDAESGTGRRAPEASELVAMTVYVKP